LAFQSLHRRRATATQPTVVAPTTGNGPAANGCCTGNGQRLGGQPACNGLGDNRVLTITFFSVFKRFAALAKCTRQQCSAVALSCLFLSSLAIVVAVVVSHLILN
jgi:hypothetical protein